LRVLKFLLIILIVLLLILLLYIFIPRDSDRLLYFPKKESDSFCNYLKKQDMPINSIDCIFFKKADIKEGWIRTNGSINRYDLYKLATNSKLKKTRKMVAYAGENIDSFAKKIAKQANLDSKTVLQIYNKLSPFKEGGIVAKRYDIPYNVTEHSTIAYMLAKSEDIFKKYGDINSKEFKDKLIIASIIQKETQKKDEMPLVASVIYNRLKKGIKLQMDATLNHGKNAHTIVTPSLIKKDNSKYNTYKFKGLPPEPLCFVSESALNSAFNPAKTDYLYFVKSKNGHKFSAKYNMHTKNVRKYKTALYQKRVKKVLQNGVTVKLPTLLFVPSVPSISSTLKLK